MVTNVKPRYFLISGILIFFVFAGYSQRPDFPWPEGKRMAISLTFDDARNSNPNGARLLSDLGVHATFYVNPGRVKDRLSEWKTVVQQGHEIGNHSMLHSCSGNFGWTTPLEDYTLDRMEEELLQANKEIEELLGITAVSYAYPCGQTTIGEGKRSQSFIPLISGIFNTGRLWLSEAPVDPWYCDMAALTGMQMDNKSFEEILPMIEVASAKGQWLVLAGHETAETGSQITYLSMLKELCEYANDPANGIWIAPVGVIGDYVKQKRDLMLDTINIPRIAYASESGEIVLPARQGKGVGPEISFMPEWSVFGWFTGQDRVEWEADIPESGRYKVELEWSVSDEEAGKEFTISTTGGKLTGIVGESGSWETFKRKSIGEIYLQKGYQKIVFRPSEEFEDGALLDLRELKLTSM